MADRLTDSELVESLEDALQRIERAIDERLADAGEDRLEADRLFVLAGEVDAALRAASSRLGRVRAALEGSTREAT